MRRDDTKMLRWLVIKVDELLAISMRVAVAMESIAVSLRHMHSPDGLQGEINSYHDVFNRIHDRIATVGDEHDMG